MLTQKTKIIILISGSTIGFLILIAVLFDVLPSSTPIEEVQPDIDTTQDVSFLDEEPVAENTIFDAQNKDALTYLGEDSSEVGVLEQEAQDLARFFVERFGSYSSDAGFTYIDELLPFMSQSMQTWITTYKQQQPKRDTYFAVTTEIASTQTESFSLAQRTARIALVANRTEQTSTQTVYQQEVSVALAQSSAGEWFVSGIFWGEKL